MKQIVTYFILIVTFSAFVILSLQISPTDDAIKQKPQPDKGINQSDTCISLGEFQKLNSANIEAYVHEDTAAYERKIISIGKSGDTMLVLNNPVFKNAVKVVYVSTLSNETDILLSSTDISVRQIEFTRKNKKEKVPCTFFAAIPDKRKVNLSDVKLIIIYRDGKMKLFDKNYR